MQYQFRIQRFNPNEDRILRFQDYQVELDPHQTVLDVLLRIWESDPGLSFRRSCRSGICGSCAVSIDGRPRLACQTILNDLGEGRVTVEPLPVFRVLKDLVVDIDPFLTSLKSILPWLVERPDRDGLMSPERFARLEEPAACILCGICGRAAALVKTERLAFDPRDALGLERLKLAAQLGILPEEVSRRLDHCPKHIRLDGQEWTSPPPGWALAGVE